MKVQERAIRMLDRTVNMMEFTVIFYAVVAVTTICVALEWGSLFSAWVSGVFSIRGVNIMCSLRKAHTMQRLVKEGAKVEIG